MQAAIAGAVLLSGTLILDDDIKTMPRRPASFTQADVARAIRAAKQAGAESVEVRPNGTIVVLLKDAPAAPEESIPVKHDITL